MSSKKISGFKAAEIKSRMSWDKLKGNKIIILDIEETTFIPYLLPIVQALKKRSDKISYYIASHYPGHALLNDFEVPLNKQFQVTLSKEFSQADIFLSPHIYGVGNPDTFKIHINHNQPVKYDSYRKDDFINFDAHFLTSPLHREQTEITIEKYNLAEKKIQLFNTGYAKSDKLLQGEYDRDQVLSELGLDANLKTILYAPSWDEGLSLRSFGEKVIENLLSVKNINIIVKLHPISYCSADGPNYEFYTGGINWTDRLSHFEENKNFRHVTSNNIDPMLSASDLMVTDVSSVALEFIMLDKPVIYIDCPEYFEKTLKKTYSEFGDTNADFARNNPRANAGRHTGKVVENISELPIIIEESLANPDEFSMKRKEFAKQLSYNPGHAADAAANKILELIESR